MTTTSKAPRSIDQQIADVIRNLAEFNLDELNRTMEPIKEGFHQFKPQVASVVELMRSIKEVSWEVVPNVILVEVQECLSRLNGLIQQLSSFKLDPTRPAQEQGNRVFQNFIAQGDTFNKPPLQFYCARLSSFIGIAAYLDRGRQDSIHAADDLQKKVQEAELYLSQRKTEIDKIITAAAAAAVDVGAGRHSAEFGKLSASHETFATRWLWATVVFTLTAFAASYFIFDVWGMLKHEDAPLTFGQVMPRVLVVSLLYSLSLWSARNYKSHRHLHVINKHRESALQTFRSFVEAADNDPAVKNAILLECTKSIFGHTASGYLESDPPPISSTIVDVIRSATRPDGTK